MVKSFLEWKLDENVSFDTHGQDAKRSILQVIQAQDALTKKKEKKNAAAIFLLEPWLYKSVHSVPSQEWKLLFKLRVRFFPFTALYISLTGIPR